MYKEKKVFDVHSSNRNFNFRRILVKTNGFLHNVLPIFRLVKKEGLQAHPKRRLFFKIFQKIV